MVAMEKLAMKTAATAAVVDDGRDKRKSASNMASCQDDGYNGLSIEVLLMEVSI